MSKSWDATTDAVPGGARVGKVPTNAPQPLSDHILPPTTESPAQRDESTEEETAEDRKKEKLDRKPKPKRPRGGQLPALDNSRSVQQRNLVESPAAPLTMFGSAKPVVPLFIASIGNPAPKYANTFHSAGHVVIARIRELREFAAFRKDRRLANGEVSYQTDPTSKYQNTINPFKLMTGRRDERQPEEIPAGEENWTLWQSPTLMNTSGKAVRTAWNEWLKESPEFASSGLLVVLHDELESPLGKVKVRASGGSNKGHNGLKSIAAHLPNTPYVKVGIGIGRPESRSPEDVSKYVLKKMSPHELITVREAAGNVIGKLRDIQEGKI